MRHPALLPAIVAALVVACTPAAQAQKKSTEQKAVDTAKKLLDGLLGDDPKPQHRPQPGGRGAPRMDGRILGEQAQMFGGTYRADRGDSVAISPAGAGGYVEMSDAKGTYRGVGFAVDGYFVAGFDPGQQGGVIVYRIDGGKLHGTGVSYVVGGIGVLAENLEGSKKLAGDYKITSAASADGASYSGTCGIKQVADNSYKLTWDVGGENYFGVGFVMGPNMWVAWSPKKDAFLTVFERDEPGTLKRHALFNTGIPPMQLATVRLQQGAPAGGFQRPAHGPVAGAAEPPLKKDRFGNLIIDPPPGGLERPIDLPPGAVGKPMVGVAGAPPPPPAAAPGLVLAPGQTAADLAEKKSKDEGGGEVTLTVTNATRGAIRVNWTDQDGTEGKSDDTIPAGETVEMGTTGAGHFFRARDAKSNALLQEFRVKNNGGKFNIAITGGGVGPVAAAKPPPAKVVAANPAPAANAGGVPAKGPHVDKATAKRQLKANMQQQIDEFMKLHNDARADVGVPPLKWDPQLAAVAQQWADTLTARGSNLVHNDQVPYGENLAGYLPEYGERPVHGAKMWYDEIKDYRDVGPMNATNYAQCGHYTQMVARRSSRVGFGISMAPDGMAILCANYDPPGNMQGTHPINP